MVCDHYLRQPKCSKTASHLFNCHCWGCRWGDMNISILNVYQQVWGAFFPEIDQHNQHESSAMVYVAIPKDAGHTWRRFLSSLTCWTFFQLAFKISIHAWPPTTLSCQALHSRDAWMCFMQLLHQFDSNWWGYHHVPDCPTTSTHLAHSIPTSVWWRVIDLLTLYQSGVHGQPCRTNFLTFGQNRISIS